MAKPTSHQQQKREDAVVTESLDILGQTDAEEVELMSQGLAAGNNSNNNGMDLEEDSNNHLGLELDDVEAPDTTKSSRSQAFYGSFTPSSKKDISTRPSSPTTSTLSQSAIPFLKQLDVMVASKRDAFFALYFHLPQQGRNWLGRNNYEAPTNPNTTHEVTFGELWDAAGVVSYNLRHTWKVQKGQRVMLCYGYGPSGLVALLGCWRAGAVAILVEAPPVAGSTSGGGVASKLDKDVLPPSFSGSTPIATRTEALDTLTKRAEECQPIAMVLTDKQTFKVRNADMINLLSSTRKKWLSKTQWRATESLKHNPVMHVLKTKVGGVGVARGQSFPPGKNNRPYYTYDEPNLSLQELAMIQYTAGSTGEDPLPVMINFASLQASLDMTSRFFQSALQDGSTSSSSTPLAKVSAMTAVSFTSPGACWGIVHTTLLPMLKGWCMYYMSPQEFAAKPLLWLQRMSQHKITWAMAPDTDYPRVVEAFLRAKQANNGICPVNHLDLSCVRHWHTVGQPLRAETHALVTSTLQEYGLRKSWYSASYGLTEHVAGALLFLPFDFVTYKHQQGEQKKGTMTVPTTTTRVAVASRYAMDPEVQVKVVDPKTRQEVIDGEIGELWLSSPAVASGYYRNSEMTTERFGMAMESAAAASSGSSGSNDRYLRTGDAAFFQDDHLYLCGPLSDTLVFGEKTYFPQDIEWIAEVASSDVIPGCVAAIASSENDNQGLEIVFEIASNHYQEPKDVCDMISQAVAKRSGVTPKRVVAIREGTVPRTANGKIKRHTTKQRLQDETLDVLVDSIGLNSGNPVEEGSDEYVHREKALDKVLANYFGMAFKEGKSWEELGLTSLSSIDLRYDIAANLRVHIPSNCFENYPTPAALKDSVLKTGRITPPVELPYVKQIPSLKISWLLLGILQAILAVIILLLFSVSILPIWYVFDELVESNLMVAMIPMYMASFSVIVLLAKWIVIGFYTPGRMSAPSIAYLRWWFVDRLVDMWEFWVGRFFLNTPMLNVYYILMGANIFMSAKLDGFCREFDLITVGPYASLQHRSLRARRFTSWDRSESGPTMTFRSIVVGSRSKIRGMLSPGATVGENSLVEKLAVVPEGCKVGDRVIVSGNPGVVTGRPPLAQPRIWWLVGLCKIKWLFIEFFIFNVIELTCQWTLKMTLPMEYYDMWVIWWMLFVSIFGFLSLVSSVVIKWIFLGKRKIGKYEHKSVMEVTDWAVDYHFFLSTILFRTFSLNSRFCNFILMLHGMDIDLASKVYIDSFPPSKMDFIHVRQSYVAGVSFDVTKYGAYYPTVIQNSSIGELAHVGAGLVIQNAVIAPASVVSTRTELPKDPKTSHKPPTFTIWDEFLVSSVYTVVIAFFKLSVYAGYRYWKLFISFPYSPGWTSIFVFAGAIGIQSTLWMLFILMLQFVTYIGMSENQPIPWSHSLYAVYLSSSESFQTWSAVPILWGTQLFNDIARVFGASLEGRTLYFGTRIYDGPFLAVSNRTVSDGSLLCGHSIVYEQVTCGPTRVAGLLQEGTLVIANANITAKESDPWRPIVPKTDAVLQHFSLDASQDLEAPETKIV